MKFALLTAATCFLGFCIGGSADSTKENQNSAAQNKAAPSYAQLQYSTMYESQFQPTGLIGSYLSANFAQRRFDWKSAYEHMDDIIEAAEETSTTDYNLYRRAMLVAIGAGEFKDGFALADKILEEEDTESLTIIVKAIQALKKGEYQNIRAAIDTMPDDGLSRFMRPILIGWMDANEGKLTIEKLSSLSLFHAQAILIADYLNKPDKMAEMLESAMLAQDLKILDIENIADGFTHIDKYDRAKQLYEQILIVTPDYKDVKDKIAAIEAGEKPDYFNPADSLESGVSRAFYDLARLLYHQGNDETAQFVVQLSAYLNPERVRNDILLGSIAASNMLIEDAISYYSKVPEGHESYIATRREIADLLEEAKRKQEAISILEDLANKYGDIESLIQIGDIYRRDDKFDKAITTYNRAAGAAGGSEIPAEYWHLLYVRGMAYEQNGQWNKAQNDLEAALNYRPDNPYILNYLGYAWADQGTNIEKAKDMIEKAVRLEPTDGYITDSLGWVLYRTGQYKEAVTYLERAVALLPYDPIINDHLGDAYWQAGRRNEARFQWERARNVADESDTKLLSFIAEKLENGLSESLIIKQAGANYNQDQGTKVTQNP